LTPKEHECEHETILTIKAPFYYPSLPVQSPHPYKPKYFWESTEEAYFRDQKYSGVQVETNQTSIAVFSLGSSKTTKTKTPQAQKDKCKLAKVAKFLGNAYYCEFEIIYRESRDQETLSDV
jgi:hypothetical protein